MRVKIVAIKQGENATLACKINNFRISKHSFADIRVRENVAISNRGDNSSCEKERIFVIPKIRAFITILSGQDFVQSFLRSELWSLFIGYAHYGP